MSMSAARMAASSRKGERDEYRLLTVALTLALYGQNALQGGGGDAQPLGDGDVVFHFLRDDMAAHHQHPGAPEQVAANVDAVLMLLGHRIVEKKGQEQRGADGGIARLVDGPAILRRLFRVFHPQHGAPGEKEVPGTRYHLYRAGNYRNDWC